MLAVLFITTKREDPLILAADVKTKVDWHYVLTSLAKESSITNYEHHVKLICKAAEDVLEQELLALQSALLAKVLVERLRNNVDFKDEVKQNFLTLYTEQCSQLLSSIPQIKFFEYGEINKSLLIRHAKTLIEFALDQLKNLPLSSYQAYVYTSQWRYFNLLDNHQAAQKSARLAIVKHSKQQHFIDLSEKYSYLGTSLLQLGQFREALHAMRKGLALTLSSVGEQKYADAHFRLGFAYLKAGDYDSAKRYFELFVRLELGLSQAQPIDIGQCHRFSVRAAKGLVNLGKVDRVAGNASAALIKHQCAVKVLQSHSDYYYYVALLEKAKDLKALSVLDDARELASKLANSEGILASHKLQALLIEFAIELQQTPPIYDIDLEQRIIELIGLDDDNPEFVREYIEFLQLKMKYAATTGDEQAFVNNAKAGFAMIRKYRQTGLLSDAWLTTQYSFVEHYVDAIYSNQFYIQGQKLAVIINVLDSYYALNYFDARKFYKNYADNSLPQELKTLIENQRKVESQIINADDQTIQDLQVKLDNANEALMAFQEYQPDLTKKDDNGLGVKHSLTKMQAALSDNEILIRYFVSHTQSMALVLSNDKVFIHQLPKIEVVRNTVAKLTGAIEKRNLSELMKQDVFNQLLPIDYIKQNQINRLIIIPDDVLHVVPFSAIDMAPVHRKYQPLSSQAQVIRTHSVDDYLFAEIKPQWSLKSNNELSIFADPALIEKPINESNSDADRERSYRFKRLKDTAKEALNIKRIYDDHQVNLYLGEQMTNERLLAESARRSKILHIATHGFYDPQVPDVVGIATYNQQSKNDFLSLTELLSEPFYSDLVVISGCETMLGKYYKGTGMKSFTRGFLSKGAGSVIGSLWKVPDNSTAVFMSYFYQALYENNNNTIVALNIAKQRLSEHEDYDDPFYWSGFVLTAVNRRYEQIHFK